MVQWLRICLAMHRDVDSISGRGTRIPHAVGAAKPVHCDWRSPYTLHGRPSTAKKKKKEEVMDGVLLKITINTLHVNINNIL